MEGTGEALVKLRNRMTDALKMGVVDEKHHGIVQQILLQIMNDAERQKQSCLNQVETLQSQIMMARGQANGYTTITSIVYATLDGFIKQAERAVAEERERAVRDGVVLEQPQPLQEVPKKRGRKKNVPDPS